MLDISHVSKSFNIGTPVQKDALIDLNLHLNEGDFVTVIGGNGAGKSTMLNAVAGVFGVDEGQIKIAGNDVTKDPEYKRAQYIGRVFQDPLRGTAGDMWIEENLAFALRRGKRRSFKWGISNKEREQFVELLKTLDLGLENRLSAKVGLLSGGQYKDKNPNNIKRAPFTDEEIEKLWKASTFNQADSISIILMMIYSGVRVGELRELRKENVHLNEKYFYIESSKTPAGIRNVPIADKVLPFFRYWMQKNPECKYLIHTDAGKMFQDRNYRDSYWLPVIEQLQLDPDHHPHDTRHTCVSLFTKAGVDERLIKKIVGHAGKGVTEQVYTHIEMEPLLEAVNMI